MRDRFLSKMVSKICSMSFSRNGCEFRVLRLHFLRTENPWLKTPITNDRENRMSARVSVKQLSPIRCHCRTMLSVPEQWRTAGIVPLLRSDDYWVCDTISSASDRSASLVLSAPT